MLPVHRRQLANNDALDIDALIVKTITELLKVTQRKTRITAPGKFYSRAAIYLGIAAILAGLLILMVGNVFYQGEREQFAAGWRSARVVEIGEGRSIKVGKASDCRNNDVMEDLSNSRYMLAIYRAGPNRMRNRIVPLSSTQQPRVGDEVLVNINYCNDAVQLLPKSK